MDSSGNIRELTKEQPLRADEVPLTEEQATTYSQLPRKERRRLFRQEAKRHRKELKKAMKK